MSFFTRLRMRGIVGRHSRVRMSADQWSELIAELGRRAGGVRESGAFLLAKREGPSTTVRRIVYFDDVDPGSLTGGITLGASAFAALWEVCAAARMRVIADVHTHPRQMVEQSGIDAANPLVAMVGHIAIIVPDLAAHAVRPDECGVHLYRGSHRWTTSLGRAAATDLYVGRWP